MDLELDIFHEQVAHVQQKYGWDCGIASVQMVLSSANHHNHLAAILKEIRADPVTDFKKRPWTIDLCNILYRLQVDFVFFTTATLVNDALSSLKFYSKAKKDKKRVDALLENLNLQAFIEHTSLSEADLINQLKSGPLILLVNGNKLKCRVCRKTNRIQDWSKIFCFSDKSSFFGHYVVIMGYSRSDNTFYYRNPALRTNLCEIQAQDLDQARRCMGTDQDIIAVRLGGSINVEPSPVTSQYITTRDTMQR